MADVPLPLVQLVIIKPGVPIAPMRLVSRQEIFVYMQQLAAVFRCLPSVN